MDTIQIKIMTKPYKPPQLYEHNKIYFEKLVDRIKKGQDYIQNPDLTYIQILDAKLLIESLRIKAKAFNSLYRIKQKVP